MTTISIVQRPQAARAAVWSWLLFAVCVALSVVRPANGDEVVVETVVATLSPIREFEFAEGTVNASQREYLVFEASGRVNFVKTSRQGYPLREGQRVTEGQLLATLESDSESASMQSAQSSLDAARAELRSAQTAYERAENLKAGGAISERDYERAVTSLEDSRARVDRAEASLVRTSSSVRGAQLIAPFDGVVAFVNIREGQYVARSSFNASTESSAIRTAPIVLINPDSFEVLVDVPAFVGERLAEGQDAFVLRQEALSQLQKVGTQSSDELLRQFLPGDIVAVSPAIYPEDRSIRTRIRMRDTTRHLRDGEHVTVWLQVGIKENAVVVPPNALINRDGRTFLYVVDENGRAQMRIVEVGLVGLAGVEIVSGVVDGDRVITSGRNRVRDGSNVIFSRDRPSTP